MIAVTGATGHLGRLVIKHLLDREVPAGDIIAVVRNAEKAADLAEQGVRVRQADYTDRDALDTALDGVEKLLLISGSEVGQRIAQHTNVIEAATAAGVQLLVYTSILRADTSNLALAAEHAETERRIKGSGIPYIFARNGWYIENYTENLAPVFATGSVFGAAQKGRVAAAPRNDYAEAAAVLLVEDHGTNKAFELGGDAPFTYEELAAAIAKASGKGISYQDLPVEAYAAALKDAGVPGPFADVLADSDKGVANGELDTDSTDLVDLIHRPTAALLDVVKDAVK
jgi:NAD(P)H dehydrogenase (quinone)